MSYHFIVEMYEFARGGVYQIEVFDPYDFESNYQLNPVTNGYTQLYDLGVYGFTIGDASGNNYCTDLFGPKEYDWECSYYSTASSGETFSYRLLEKQYATSYAGEGLSFSVSASDFVYPDSRFGFSYAIIAGSCGSNPTDVDVDCTWDQPDGNGESLEFYGL